MINFIKKYGKWILVSILLFIFVVLVNQLLNSKLNKFDDTIYNFIISIKSPFWTSFFKFISFFASPLFLVIMSILLFVIFKNKKYAILSLCNLGLVFIVNQILKLFFSRPRPFELMLVEEIGYSFPSAHAMVGTAFFGMLIYLIWQTKINKKQKQIYTIIISILVILICISRIYLGVHYASDIVGGFTLALSYLIIATSIINYYLKYKRKQNNE